MPVSIRSYPCNFTENTLAPGHGRSAYIYRRHAGNIGELNLPREWDLKSCNSYRRRTNYHQEDYDVNLYVVYINLCTYTRIVYFFVRNCSSGSENAFPGNFKLNLIRCTLQIRHEKILAINVHVHKFVP